MKSSIIGRLLILNLIVLSFLLVDNCKKELDPTEQINDGNLSEKSFMVPIAFPEQGEIVSFNMNGDTVFFRKVDSLYIFQGDIMFTENQIKEAAETKGTGSSIFDRYWPGGIIPYKISGGLSQKTQDLINAAISQFNGATNVKFIQRTNESSYCEFVKSPPNIAGSSTLSVGRLYPFGSQTIFLKDDADLNLWIVEHEMCHVLGMFHEQCRSDRDEYIKVDIANIKPKYKDDFKLVETSVNPTQFDFGSIMMFPSMVDEMAIDKSRNLIKKLDGSTNWVMEAKGLSTKDIETINYLYPLDGICSPALLFPENDALLDNGCEENVVNNLMTWYFKWSRCPGASSYNLYVKSPSARNPAIDVEVKDPEYLDSKWAIAYGLYGWTWKVRAKVHGDWQDWSAGRKFNIERVNYDCPPVPVTPAEGRDFLFGIMKDIYYWYNMPEAMSVTEENKNNFSDPWELLEAMRYRSLDRWSFVNDASLFWDSWSGLLVGHGILVGLDQEGIARISQIQDNSTLYARGVRRGWIIKQINGVDVTPSLFENNQEGIGNLLGPYEPGITNTFLFVNPSGEEITISSTKASYQAKTVILSEILKLPSGRLAGHLVFDSFTGSADQELATAFAFFKANGINDLILDMRYNGGGFAGTAIALSSYIAGNSLAGSIFGYAQNNDRYSEYNSSTNFITTESPLDLSRVVIITSRGTASASELVINCLKPYINVVTIGDATDGKPVGLAFIGFGQYVMAPIVAKFVNSLNYGDYWEGIPPTISSPDDITHDYNDPKEACLNAAINYLETGSISKGAQIFKPSPIYSEKPEWMNNLFVEKNKVPGYKKVQEIK
jgi:carboxyl-terminal processing protease